MGVLLLTVTGCGAADARTPEMRIGTLQLGRTYELDGARYVLDARFDVSGPETFELDTALTNQPVTCALEAGSYVITIRDDFRLWRDVAVAQVRVAAELASDAETRFLVRGGDSTLVVYEFLVEGRALAFDSY